MKTITLIIAILSVFCCKAQKVENDVTKAKLVGQVKTVKEYQYFETEKREEIHDGSIQTKFTYDVEGNKTEWIRYKTDNFSFNKETYKYDNHENMIEKKKYNEDGSLIYKIEYLYDKNGRLTGEKEYKPDGSIESIYVYIYSDSGIKTKKNSYRPSDGLLFSNHNYVYDDKGNMTEDINYIFDKIHSKDTYRYDNYGVRIEKKSYINLFDNGLILLYTQKYDNNGNKIEDNQYNAQGTLDFGFILKYDDQGNRTEEYSINSNGSLNSTYTYVYDKYDKNGNWIKRSQFKKGKQVTIEKREIEYY